MPYESLEVCLDDYLAGATAGVHVAQQAAGRERSSDVGNFYGEIAPLAVMHQAAAATV